jgi:hypothetical protein
MILKWEEGWHCLFKALDTLSKEDQDLGQTIFIRNMGHTVLEAIQRQLCHYAYHVGQIVYISKMVQKDWESLSIPKSGSKEYNARKFSEDKHKAHFTDEYLFDEGNSTD